jgi:hypothetical protein
MEIPLNAQVECTDGVCGRSAFVLIDPVFDQVTNLVVKEEMSPFTEYIVPEKFVTETIADTIRLSCSKADLEKMDPFIKTKFIQEKVSEIYSGYGGGMYGYGSLYYMPYAIPDRTIYENEEIQQIPPGELTVNRGTTVKATDGYVGKVDEFVVNPDSGHITHLVMREGHLWGKKDVIIPLSALAPMSDTHEDTIFLKISKHEIESLPTFSLTRRWA